jgi:protein-S-isoprenylcysteine O-methyltransferase Ste14
MLLLWFAVGLDFAFSFLLPQATILWKRTSLFFIGISLMLAGLAFRFYAMSVLGQLFTYDVAVHAGQTVVEVGPYRPSAILPIPARSSHSSDWDWRLETG